MAVKANARTKKSGSNDFASITSKEKPIHAFKSLVQTTYGRIFHLQRTIGKQATRRLFASRLVEGENPFFHSHYDVQRTLSVAPARFTPQIPVQLNQFKQTIESELSLVTGLQVRFSGNSLTMASGQAASQTAARILRMAINSQGNLFIDPTTGRAGHSQGHGLSLNVSPQQPQRRLKAMRQGIIIIHELAHEFATQLRPANYDQRMQRLEARMQQIASSGRSYAGQFTTVEIGQVRQYRRGNVQADENIPVGLLNQVRRELGMGIERVQYQVDLEYPPPPSGAQGTARLTAYTMFRVNSNPAIYLYQKMVTNCELFWSRTDFVQEFLRTGRPPVPTASQMQTVRTLAPQLRQRLIL